MCDVISDRILVANVVVVWRLNYLLFLSVFLPVNSDMSLDPSAAISCIINQTKIIEIYPPEWPGIFRIN